MAAIGDLFGSIGIGGGTGGGFLNSIIIMFFGALILGLCVFGLWWFIKKRKAYNIKIEFKIPRNIKSIRQRDGAIRIEGTLNKEWGVGFYDGKKGVVFVKRKKKKPVPMKPFDVKRFLSDSNILTVIQVGIEDYRPVLDESYIEVIDDKTGEEAALLKARIDTSESKSWKNSFEREAKLTYSIKNWVSEHGGLIAMGIVLLMNLVGFAIVLSKMPK